MWIGARMGCLEPWISVISWLVWPEGVGGSWRGRGREKGERGEQLWLLLQQQHLALQTAGSCCCLLGSPSFSHLLPAPQPPFSPSLPSLLLHRSKFTSFSLYLSPSLSLSLSFSHPPFTNSWGTCFHSICLHLCTCHWLYSTQLIVATVFISLDLLNPKFQVSSVDLLSLLGTWGLYLSFSYWVLGVQWSRKVKARMWAASSK